MRSSFSVNFVKSKIKVGTYDHWQSELVKKKYRSNQNIKFLFSVYDYSADGFEQNYTFLVDQSGDGQGKLFLNARAY